MSGAQEPVATVSPLEAIDSPRGHALTGHLTSHPLARHVRRALTPQPESRNHLPRLEALRGLAALSVFGYHAVVMRVGEPAAARSSDPVTRVGLTLNSGVTLFFLLSGFLLFRPFAESLSHLLPVPRVGAYAIRRVFRIVPAYWVALTALVLVNLHGNSIPGGPVPYYGFAQIYSTNWIAHGIGPAWSLDTEVVFYALVPALAAIVALAAASRGGRRRTIALALAALAAVSLGIKLHVLLANRFALAFERKEWLFWNLDLFAAGMAIAAFKDDIDAWLARHARVHGALPTVGLVGVIAGLGGAAVMSIHQTGTIDDVARSELYFLAGVSLLVIGLFAPERSRADSILRWRPLLVAGLVSYSLYLLHTAVLERVLPFFDAGQSVPRGVIAGVVGLAASVVAAICMFVVVERPAMRFARTLTTRREAKGGAAALPGKLEAPTRTL
jgi:peptidoglycan/LPS O-acetylase OafA/YrhL